MEPIEPVEICPSLIGFQVSPQFSVLKMPPPVGAHVERAGLAANAGVGGHATAACGPDVAPPEILEGAAARGRRFCAGTLRQDRGMKGRRAGNSEGGEREKKTGAHGAQYKAPGFQFPASSELPLEGWDHWKLENYGANSFRPNSNANSTTRTITPST